MFLRPLSTAAPTVLIATTAIITMLSSAQAKPHLNTLGMPGLIDMPDAYSLDDGNLAFTLAYRDSELRNTLAFQISDRITGVFRYVAYPEYDGGLGFYDRSFDFKYRIIDEGRYLPAVSIGLQDFGGTGIFGGEYVVATKSIGSTLGATAGIGWGVYATRGGFRNPLASISEAFATRAGRRGISQTGRLSADTYFRGDAALFGGLRWTPKRDLSVSLEYSSDNFEFGADAAAQDQLGPFNFGVTKRLDYGVDFSAYALGGKTFGLGISYQLDPAVERIPGGYTTAPQPIAPRRSAQELGWTLTDVTDRMALEAGLRDDGIGLKELTLIGPRATATIENTRYRSGPQAIGRTARRLANALPADVTHFEIVTIAKGVPISSVTVNRSDLEQFEFAVGGASAMLARAEIVDASNAAAAPVEGLQYDFGTYIRTAFFDPDSPVRADVGVAASFDYNFQTKWHLSGQLRAPIAGNLDQSTRETNSVLPPVRSNAYLYDIESDLELRYLTLERFGRPKKDVYSRVSLGYLEPMFAGVSGEMLWAPIDSRLAIGGELNYVAQRDYDMLLGVQDYEIMTGHVSAYYDFSQGYLGQVDAGRYLAGDWGATLSLDREFNNGFKVGAFFTLTDVSFDDFGEGAFDKGIRIEVPLARLLGKPTRETLGQTIRPLLRDGGARLDVRNRLYGMTRDYRRINLEERWGPFWQ